MPDDVEESREDLMPDHDPGEETLSGLGPPPNDPDRVPGVAADEREPVEHDPRAAGDDQSPGDWRHPPAPPGAGVEQAYRPSLRNLLWVVVGVGLLAFVGAAVYGISLGFEAAEKELGRIRAWEEFSRLWEPPAGEPTGEALFPPALDGFERVELDDEAEFPALGIDLFGEHAAYADGDGRRVDIAVYRVTNDERAATVLEVRDRINGEQANDESPRFTRRAFRETGRQAQFAVSPPDLYGNFWYAAGYFVFLRSGELSNRELDDVLHAFLVGLAPNGRSLPEVTAGDEA